ncbi:MAG: EamA family transporter [Flavobacteriales bacterium]|nr:EamA family transporter [Flavobacteriales bacterium]MCB9449201.1 EamA family transporter [Flavobacteriales bacterium]
MQSFFEKKTNQWLTLGLLALTWGSSFILMEKGLVAYSDTQVASLRLVFAGLVLLPVSIRRIRHLPKKTLIPIFLVGLVGNGIPAFLFTKAETVIDSSTAGIINALAPLFTLLIGISFFHLKARWVHGLGILVGLAGAVALLYDDMHIGGKAGYAGLAIIATVCYGFSINIVKGYLHSVPATEIASIGLLFVGLPSGIYLFSTDFTQHFSTHPDAWTSLGYIMILGMVGTAFAVSIFNMLIKSTSHLFAASVTYLIPIVAIFWGLFDGESMDIRKIIAILTILVSIYLVNRKT